MERGREELEEDGEKVVVIADEDDDDEEEESVREVLRDRIRLSTISIAQAEAAKNGMEISAPVMACIADLSFKYAVQLATDLEQFARHAGRKSVNMEDVLLSTHRNEQLAMSLRSICNEIRTKEGQSKKKKKRKKPFSRKEDKQASSNSIPNAIASTSRPSTHIDIMPSIQH